jgi:aminopeptidase N
VTALEKLCATFPQNTSKYLDATKGIEGTNGRNVLVKWLEISAAQGGEMSYVNDLVKYTSNSYEFVTRTNAMAALRRLNYCDKALVANCANAYLTNNGRLAGPAAETIKYFYAQHKYKKVIAEVINDSNATGKDKEKLNKLMN